MLSAVIETLPASMWILLGPSRRFQAVSRPSKPGGGFLFTNHCYTVTTVAVFDMHTIMTSSDQPSRATIDVINVWCVAVLVVSAVSVAGVVGAAVVAGEFEERNFDYEEEGDREVNEEVITETNPDGTTRIRWSEENDAEFLQVYVEGDQEETLGFEGEETVIDSTTFEVVAVLSDGSEVTVESRS